MSVINQDHHVAPGFTGFRPKAAFLPTEVPGFKAAPKRPEIAAEPFDRFGSARLASPTALRHRSLCR